MNASSVIRSRPRDGAVNVAPVTDATTQPAAPRAMGLVETGAAS